MIQKISITLVLIFSSFANAGGPNIPDGYRMLTPEELSTEWRNKDTHHYSLISGDFNGDSRVDGATLTIDLSSNQLVLWAFLAEDNGNEFQWFKLDTSDYDSILYMGLKTLEPQEMMYYRDVTDDKKHTIMIDNESIKYFASEGAASIFFWDRESRNFKMIWTSK